MLDIPGDKMIVLFVTFAILQAVTGTPINQGPPLVLFEYWVKAQDVLWDYCPHKESLVDNNDEWVNNTHVSDPETRFHCKFWKIKYYQTDGTFSNVIEQDGHMGILGPTIYGCHDSLIKVYFFNNATFRCSMHPHFAKYGKEDEGAFYQDGTSGPESKDDFIEPGGTYTYNWFITSQFRLGDGDEPCTAFTIHSHFMVDMEMNVGLFCFLVICKEGYLKQVNGKYMRRDVDHELFYSVDLINEGESLMADMSMDLCGNPDKCRQLLADHDNDDWNDQLAADEINGYRGANGPPATVCAGSRVALYLLSLMAELHYFEIRGQTPLFRHRRRAGVPLFPATFMTGLWEPQETGHWLVSCLNTEHYKQGMNAIVHVVDCDNKTLDDHLSGINRTYYIEAKMVEWCFDNGTGQDAFHGTPLTANGSYSAQYFSKKEGMIGGCYFKAQFVGYKDKDMTEETVRPAHFGLLGPVISFEEGDTIFVYLKNSLHFAISFQLEGVIMAKEEDGTFMKGEPVKYAEPGETNMYTYTVPKAVSPGDEDHACVPFLYWSSLNTEAHTAAGLVGPALSCRSGELDCVTDRQKGIDESFFLYFALYDENLSPFLDKNIEVFTNNIANKDDEDFINSNRMYGINGLSYANLQGLKMCMGQTVAWYVFSFGANEALFSPMFAGNSYTSDGNNRESRILITGMSDTYMMKPHEPGNWSINSGNVDHLNAGVTAIYTVECCGECPNKPFDFKANPPLREYFLCINEVEWDYSPGTINGFTGHDYSQPGTHGYNQVRSDGYFLGSKYKKALFFQYADATFEEEIPKHEHLGFLGPPLYCNVGESMKIIVKNNATYNYSLYSAGVGYDKTYEGLNYNDGVERTGHSIPPGGMFTYIWRCETEHGPAKDEPNCVNRIYTSAHGPYDYQAGLIGPIVVCRSGIRRKDNSRRDGYREFFIYMLVSNERLSPYFPENSTDIHDADFEASNEFDCFNGYVYGNGPGFIMYRCENIAWYIFAAGNELDIHTIHFHAHAARYTLTKTVMLDVFEVIPMTTVTAEMFAFNAGTWAMHCHFGEHAFNGMIALYHVKKECRKFPQYP